MCNDNGKVSRTLIKRGPIERTVPNEVKTLLNSWAMHRILLILMPR